MFFGVAKSSPGELAVLAGASLLLRRSSDVTWLDAVGLIDGRNFADKLLLWTETSII